MDEYGTFRPEDVADIVKRLKSDGIITFPYSGDNYTAFIVTIAGPLNPVGIMPWGGSVRGNYLVSLRLKGANYFDLLSKSDLHPDYISENLGLGNSDACQIALLLTDLKKYLRGDLK